MSRRPQYRTRIDDVAWAKRVRIVAEQEGPPTLAQVEQQRERAAMAAYYDESQYYQDGEE